MGVGAREGMRFLGKSRAENIAARTFGWDEISYVARQYAIANFCNETTFYAVLNRKEAEVILDRSLSGQYNENDTFLLKLDEQGNSDESISSLFFWDLGKKQIEEISQTSN